MINHIIPIVMFNAKLKNKLQNQVRDVFIRVENRGKFEKQG